MCMYPNYCYGSHEDRTASLLYCWYTSALIIARWGDPVPNVQMLQDDLYLFLCMRRKHFKSFRGQLTFPQMSSNRTFLVYHRYHRWCDNSNTCSINIQLKSHVPHPNRDAKVRAPALLMMRDISCFSLIVPVLMRGNSQFQNAMPFTLLSTCIVPVQILTNTVRLKTNNI